jgi:pyridoxine kinase
VVTQADSDGAQSDSTSRQPIRLIIAGTPRTTGTERLVPNDCYRTTGTQAARSVLLACLVVSVGDSGVDGRASHRGLTGATPIGMNILSIQSWVSYGHVGNASAVFPLQRLGAEVWSINTVQFSNHTGYGHWTGHVHTGEQVRGLVDGIAARNVLPQCDAVLSGYMGDAGIGEAILHAVARVREQNPAAVYCCDPVIGDVEEGVYVRPGIEEFLRDRALPQADIATPNRFELERLTRMDCATLAGVKAAIRRLAAAMRPDGLRAVLLTSLETEDTPRDHLDLLVAEGGSFHRLRTPKLPLAVNGAGDAIAALFLFHRIRTGSAVTAMEEAGSSVHGLLRRTAEAGSREILTVLAQDEFVSPTQRFAAQPC